ncbi:hypothetical protein [Methylocystis sp. JR02]|uniref:hypothetical protein n=1 Tax=Methylocystis sp. JR02 TaxID=3046284 RepID=UPI0024BB114D|nr:hypothetical protein [Methylocystis sp. JR02]MDJ0448844.1 hypothetical protein [Methylocystis sp. JR02]
MSVSLGRRAKTVLGKIAKGVDPLKEKARGCRRRHHFSRGGVTTGGEGVAARTMSTLHAVFEHAVRLGKIESNPAKGVRRLASTPRDSRRSRAEIEKLGKAMRSPEQEGEHPTGLAAVRFFLMTGFRRMEGLALERAWLNDEEGSIRFPDTKSGAQTRVHRPRLRRNPQADVIEEERLAA